MTQIVIAGTTSSGKSTILNLLCGAWIVPVSVQPNTLAPVEISLTNESAQTKPIIDTEFDLGLPIKRRIWSLGYMRLSLPFSLILKEYRLRSTLEQSGLIAKWMRLSRSDRRAQKPSPQLIELPALERFLNPDDLKNSAEQKKYATQALSQASCIICVFNAEETNPQVDEKAIRMLTYGLDRPILFALNRIDLFKSDFNEISSLERRINQIKSAWKKTHGDTQCPQIFPISAELPGIIYASLNPRSNFTESNQKRLKKIARSEPILEDLPLIPSDWSPDQCQKILSEILNKKGISKFTNCINTILDNLNT